MNETRASLIIFGVWVGYDVLSLIIGFFWFFQVVSFEKEGIRISIIKKTLRFIEWDSIDTIKESNWLKNPVYEIKVRNPKILYLYKRKKIKEAIISLGSESIKKQLN